jgi:hypothetical protein
MKGNESLDTEETSKTSKTLKRFFESLQYPSFLPLTIDKERK